MVQDICLDSVSFEHCMSFRVSKCVLANSISWNRLISVCRAGDLVTSDEGKLMQQQVWTDIVESLGSKVPSDQSTVPGHPGC